MRRLQADPVQKAPFSFADVKTMVRGIGDFGYLDQYTGRCFCFQFYLWSGLLFPDHPFLQFCFEWFRLVVYSLAPLLGGAVVCDILIGLSPDMQLFLKRRRRMFVFSELNRKSIMLAESIFKNEKPEKDIVIVFTNYRPGSDEEADALKFRANELKAICYPGDLLHLKEADHAKQYIFFLMNTKPDGSFSDDKNQVLLQSLLRAEKCIWPKKQGCHFFVFTNEGAAVEDVRGAKAAFDQRRSDDAGEVTIHVIRDYVQAAQNLLLRHPLFESIKGDRPVLRFAYSSSATGILPE